MADDPAGTPPEASPPRRHWRTRTKLILFGMLLSPLLIFVLYAMMTLSYTYSEGYRAGLLQKFSHRGWICKTYEGELAQAVVPGMAPLIWEFTVRNDSVAAQLDGLLGHKVSLHYREHRGVPTECFGSTTYYVDSVTVVHE